MGLAYSLGMSEHICSLREFGRGGEPPGKVSKWSSMYSIVFGFVL